MISEEEKRSLMEEKTKQPKMPPSEPSNVELHLAAIIPRGPLDWSCFQFAANRISLSSPLKEVSAVRDKVDAD